MTEVMPGHFETLSVQECGTMPCGLYISCKSELNFHCSQQLLMEAHGKVPGECGGIPTKVPNLPVMLLT